MIALLQRVSHASVHVGDQSIGAIDGGLVVFVGVERSDTAVKAERLAGRVLSYRVFPDADGKMNLSVQDISGALLLVPQFTLAADTATGTRASFTPAAEPALATRLFDDFVAHVRRLGGKAACGQFGADMKVSLTNDGPVTFWLNA